MRLRLLATFASLAVLSSTAAAQAPDSPGEPATRPRTTQSVAINPILLPFGVFSAEYERVIATGFTLGVGGSYIDGNALDDGYDDGYDDADDSRAVTAEAKLLYYPNENPLRGFSLGLTLGYINERDEQSSGYTYDQFGNIIGGSSSSVSEGAATLGVLLDYNWLLGRRKRFLVGTGIGARRVLKDVGGASPLAQVYPDGRLVVGFAF